MITISKIYAKNDKLWLIYVSKPFYNVLHYPLYYYET